jgi:hypothetical protein
MEFYLKSKIFLAIKIEKQNLIMKFLSANEIDHHGAAELGESLSKLLNMKSLSLNFW